MKIHVCLKLLSFLIIYCASINAQNKSKDLLRADAYFAVGHYSDAAKHYEYARRRKSTPYVLEKLLDCYLKLNDYEKVESVFLKFKKQFSFSDTQRLKYAYVLKHNGKTHLAKTELVYLYNNSDSIHKAEYLRHISSCDSITIWTHNPSAYLVFNMADLNTPYSEISPVSYKESIVFASNKEDWKIMPKSSNNNQPYFDLYMASIDYHWKPSQPKRFSSIINSPCHESSASFTSNGDKMYFTRCGENGFEKDSVKRMKLYASESINGSWIKPHAFIFNDSSYSFAHPSVEKDNKMVFFASDMKGGFGGSDIYVSIQVEDSIWSDPINLGPVINSPGNENYPFYNVDGRLYFASDYHAGMGGYDIFVASQKNGEWLSIDNLKYPINSTYDDVGIYFNADRTIGYFSSNRPGGKGKEDIYLIRKK